MPTENYDEIKDQCALCTTNEEALEIFNRYPRMKRFLPKLQRYYLYTVVCRENNKFPLMYQMNWE